MNCQSEEILSKFYTFTKHKDPATVFSFGVDLQVLKYDVIGIQQYMVINQSEIGCKSDHTTIAIATMKIQMIFKKYKHFRVDIQLYQHEWNWKKLKNEKLCGFLVFPIPTSVDISVYLYGIMFYISFIV